MQEKKFNTDVRYATSLFTNCLAFIRYLSYGKLSNDTCPSKRPRPSAKVRQYYKVTSFITEKYLDAATSFLLVQQASCLSAFFERASAYCPSSPPTPIPEVNP